MEQLDNLTLDPKLTFALLKRLFSDKDAFLAGERLEFASVPADIEGHAMLLWFSVERREGA